MGKMQHNTLAALRSAKAQKGLTKRELMKITHIKRQQSAEFATALQQLVESGQAAFINGRYSLPEKVGLIPAVIVKVSATFGFAKPENGGKDIFIPGKHLRGVMPGDRALLEILHGQGGSLPEGAVSYILEEANPLFSGVIRDNGRGHLTVFPDRYTRFPIQLQPHETLRAGDKILARIVKRAKRHPGHVAEVVELFGDSGSAAVCAKAILRENGIVEAFPEPVLEEARATPAEIHPREIASRLDLREKLIFTIDGADAKDLDDAVSLTRHAGGWSLGVHIADVSHYVAQTGAINREAYARGTSVYYADQVVPMLPPELSNGICSLNPQEDRLAFSALIELGPGGEMKSFRFAKTVIHSQVRGVYSEVNALLAQTADARLRDKYASVCATLHDMNELSLLLRQNRERRGGVNLDTVESKIVVGAEGEVAEICRATRGDAEKMIEEFMLVANEAAATLALRESLPFLYRVHESPSPDRLEELLSLLDKLGVKAKRQKGGVSPDAISAITREVAGSPVEGAVNNMVLRAMSKAKYSDQSIGHFGLALANYSHFTSPIRRFPDLLIHRILTGYVTGAKRETVEARFRNFVKDAAAQSTGREIAAMTAERDCAACYKAEYMRRFIGEEMAGIISAVTGFGLFVQLPSTVEGFVDVGDFPGRGWKHDGAASYHSPTGTLTLGQSVNIRVAAVDVSAGRVTFLFA